MGGEVTAAGRGGPHRQRYYCCASIRAPADRGRRRA
jgi:hypothetical protein